MTGNERLPTAETLRLFVATLAGGKHRFSLDVHVRGAKDMLVSLRPSDSKDSTTRPSSCVTAQEEQLLWLAALG